jgi:hypothetical protein
MLGILMCCNDCTVSRLKRCCGVRVFDPKLSAAAANAVENEEEIAYLAAKSSVSCFCCCMRPRGWVAWSVCAVNFAMLILGTLILLFAIAAIAIAKAVTVAIALVRVGILVFLVALAGVNGSCKLARRGPSCWLLTYVV